MDCNPRVNKTPSTSENLETARIQVMMDGWKGGKVEGHCRDSHQRSRHNHLAWIGQAVTCDMI
jgi:hypothetical protein